MTKDTDEQDLAAVLKGTLGGLEELDCFLDAVEKLAVTSRHVFTLENRVVRLPKGINPDHVQLVIVAARVICPLLLEFKRDASVFFLPKLQNVEVLSYQLNEYITTTQNICGKFQKSSFSLNRNDEAVVDLHVDLSDDDIQRMLCHINQLKEIRMNQHFRMVFLFQEVKCSGFIREFSERRPGMLRTLEDLEQSAVELDRMNKGAKISSVAGSSVAAAGGVLSIAGLALIPVTAGLSLGLIIGGTALGITSGVNSVVTTTTEILVNRTSQGEASKSFQSFMEDVQSIQDCLEAVSAQPAANIQCLPSAIPDIGQIAVKGSLALALTRSARKLFIGLNVVGVGVDVFFICKDSISLAKGSETEVSKFIRARAALWRSEMDSWKKIHDFLLKGLPTSERNKAVLETPFYPERETKKRGETGMKISFDEADVLETPFYPKRDTSHGSAVTRVIFCVCVCVLWASLLISWMKKKRNE